MCKFNKISFRVRPSSASYSVPSAANAACPPRTNHVAVTNHKNILHCAAIWHKFSLTLYRKTNSHHHANTAIFL